MDKEEKSIKYYLLRKIIVATFWLLLFLLFFVLNMINPICFMYQISDRFKGSSTGIISLILLSLIFSIFLFSLIFAIISRSIKKEKLMGKAFNILDITTIIPVIMMIFLMVDVLFFSVVKVSGLSMNNTLMNGDTILAYHAPENTISKEDIVILYTEVYGDNMLIVKRVKATEGDTVSFKNVDGNAILTINGIEINTGSVFGRGYEFFDDYTLKENEIFVVGDNYYNSIDSRYLGVFKIKGRDKNATFCAKAVYSIKPFGKIEKDLAHN